eukprot:CAMPEP_0196825018 /NCGR_PEP_ID=MMETSP1362-20130617/92812_1 /TAXON_ID=163516 /ORGANISM="Leptocylindrus danicus, Strain CCMP1856" /LENGTH=188 /DNA_ID=CAMNT_0042205383 /DNA_START=374 /DNA_END=940 /DNA_ORIENTATION=-
MPSIRRTNPSTHTHADALLTTDHKEQKPKRTIITGRAKDKHGQWGEFKVVLNVERKEKIVRSSSSRKPETVVSYHTSLADAFKVVLNVERKEKIARSSSSRKPETVVSYHTSLADATFCPDNDLRRKEKKSNHDTSSRTKCTKEERHVHWEDESNYDQVLAAVARHMNGKIEHVEKKEKSSRHSRRTH